MITTGDENGSQWLPGDDVTGPSNWREAKDLRKSRGAPTEAPRPPVRSIWKRALDKADGVSFGGFYLDGDQLVAPGRQFIPLKGVTATVEQGMQASRSTATRVVGGALLAGGVGALLGGVMKKNELQVYVTLTIPGRAPVSLSGSAIEEPQARRFVAKVNALAAADASDKP